MEPIKNAVCPACSLLCDDIEISQDASRLKAKNACAKGQSFFEIQWNQKSTHLVTGAPAQLKEAVAASVEILNRSKAPLICGLDQLTTQAQQTAWKIADRLGATIDTTFSNNGRSSMFSLQRVGKVTATIGEIASRSDLIVFWFCDPEQSHPRLLERLAREGAGREVLVIGEANGWKNSKTIKVARNSEVGLLAVLRAIIDDKKYDREMAESVTGLGHSQLENLAGKLKAAKYGSLLHGQTNEDSTFDLANDSLASLIRLLNNHTRFVGMKLRTDGNAHSGENVLAWSSGYPMAVNYNHSFPRYNQLEYSAETLLLRNECDAILFATGADLQTCFASLSRTAKDHLASIPKIAISPIPNFPSDVVFEVGVPGLTESGEYCRNDDVSLPVNTIHKSDLDSADDILLKILSALS